MNNTRGQQITPNGIAQRSGLEIFNTVTTFNGRYVNWGDAFSYGTQLGSDPDYIVDNAALDPHIDALTNAPQTVVGQWMRYHTAAGSNYAGTTAPTSGNGYYNFYGQFNSPNSSYSGMYQMMSLIKGVEYEIDIDTPINTAIGVIYVNVYTKQSITSPTLYSSQYKLISSKTITYPIIRTRIGNVKSIFKASSPKDIIVIYFTTLDSTDQNVTITNISVREKEEYLVPIYADDMYGNSHKVLRRAEDQTLSDV